MKSGTIASIKIVTACFVINFLYGGAGRLGSVFFVESIYRYEISRKHASLPYILVYMVRSLCGPVLGYLQQIFEIKTLVIFGNVLATISIAACFFADNILTVTILWGIIFGVCFALGTQFLPSLLNDHFTVNRSKANGFAYAGACFGGIMLPPIMDACIEYYGLNGSFLVLAGIMGHLIPFTFLLKSRKENSKSVILKGKDEEKRIGMKDDKKAMFPSIHPCDKNNGNNSSAHANDTATETLFEPDDKFDVKTCASTKTKNHTLRENMKKEPPLTFSLKNFKLFIDPTFIVMLIITAGTTLITTTMWTIILDFVRDKGIGVNLEIYYVMIMAIADIFGRTASGFAIDKNYLPTFLMTSISFMCSGLTLLGLVFAYNYLLLMFIEFLLPVFYGFTLILQIALIHEFIQPERRVMAMVSRFVLYSPLSLTISPIIGYFRGDNGSYDGVVFSLMGFSFFCGFISLSIPYLAKRRRTASDIVS
ncbi:monocarboxylate transporter 12-B-like [Parasteatoda tepidariorum]|uniref:monocarboxylate transporter 12-B-like n=1 Tax=Parasteatoda tepidariorum TaxID=114398 RepID=UPI0039BD0E50